MTLDELLLEWSYRSDKGYPSLDNPSDVSILKQILEQLDLPANVIIKRVVEKALSNSDITNSITRGDSPDRADIILNKIEKGEKITLTDGSTVTIDKEQSAEAIQILQSKNIPKGSKLTFTTTSGETVPLTKFEKTTELGGGSGAGGGSQDTRIMESAHCYACAIAYHTKQSPITEEDLNRENFEQAASKVNVDASIEEIEEFLERKPKWYNSITKAVNKIYELFPNKNYTFHRNSEQVERLYNAWKQSLEKDEESIEYSKMKDDKWNPADIWLFSDKTKNIDWSGNLEVLNGQIADLYEDSELVGVSLKMIGKKSDVKTKTFNDPDIDPENYKYEGYRSSPNSANSEIIFTGGKATARMFSIIKSFNIEIKGKTAQGGKAGMEAINTILERNGLDLLPPNQEVIDAFQKNDETYYNKLYYLYDRFVTNISGEEFLQKYENSKLGWVIGKFYSLLLIEKLEDNKPNPANEIINDIMRYAYSSTKDSSKFIKIYELLK